eukprot:TRINITY_DN12882_c0_g1_i1.p1 TRINITY_DN12882_c0_g1~~TRINITY_DN12882_c0_g1_i1.p1  ORF type:complete len:332 (-),score=93.61 TRINITY_DN12882_c0_g1_i1:132-1127(-)
MFKGKKIKKPGDLVKACKTLLLTIDKKGASHKDYEKLVEELSRFIASIKTVLYGDGEREPNQEHAAALAEEAYNVDFIELLVTHMGNVEFEAKKDSCSIFNNLLRRQTGTDRFPTVEHIAKNPSILSAMIDGYKNPDFALTTGAMVREAIKHESLARILLREDNFYPLFDFVDMPNFDIASDSFSTFKDLLTNHKAIVAEFLEANYDRFFENYKKLLSSQNYVTKRQSLKLLGELLLDRANFNVMTKFIALSSNLKQMMMLLRDKSRSIQFEAFHVFKVFVANPNKPQAILDILVKNKSKLMSYLGEFHNDKDDEQFTDEKAYLLRQIESL